MEFIKYLTGSEAQSYWAEENFDNVANIKGAETAAAHLVGTEKEIYNAMVKNLEETNIYPTPVEYPDYQNTINPIIDNVMLGKITPDQGLKQAEKQVKKLKQ